MTTQQENEIFDAWNASYYDRDFHWKIESDEWQAVSHPTTGSEWDVYERPIAFRDGYIKAKGWIE